MGIFKGASKKSSSMANFDPFEGLDDAFVEKNLLSDFFEKANNSGSKRAKNKNMSPKNFAMGDSLKSIKSEGHGVKKPRVRMYALMLVLVSLTGFALAKSDFWSIFASKKIVYAYFEVRALDGSGRPIAGAVVKNGGKRVGTTDSFGEWRRYMRVPLGATVPVTLAKKTSTEVLFATKNFAVPLVKPEHSEIELRGSVQLQVADQNNVVANQAVQSTPNDFMRHSSKEQANAKAPSAEVVSPKVAETAKENLADASTSIPKNNLDNTSDQATEIKIPTQFVSNHNSVWIEGNGSVGSVLNREVVPALVQRSREIGLKIDPSSPWKIRLTSLIDKPSHIEKEGGGLILVSSFDGEGGGIVREFLRNYQADSRITARGILYILAHHVNKNVSVIKHGTRWLALLPANTSEIWKLAPNMSLVNGVQTTSQSNSFLLSSEEFSDGKVHGFYLRPSANDPCPRDGNGCELKTKSYAEVSPVPTWTKLKLKTSHNNKDPMKIFVSGYEAKPIGDKVYEYWGQDKSRANVTVVQNGRVLLRTQVVGDAINPSSLGAPSISKR